MKDTATKKGNHYHIGSVSGGLHASSMGDTYPWSVQPRVTTDAWWDSAALTYRHSFCRTVWVAWNAHTNQESGRFMTYEDAEVVMNDNIRLQGFIHSLQLYEDEQRNVAAGRLLPDVRR